MPKYYDDDCSYLRGWLTGLTLRNNHAVNVQLWRCKPKNEQTKGLQTFPLPGGTDTWDM